MPEPTNDSELPPRKGRHSARSQMQCDYVTRHELLAIVPLCMSSIDNLEKLGIFPSRFRIEPTRRVAWKRREVEKFLEARARKRVHQLSAK